MRVPRLGAALLVFSVPAICSAQSLLLTEEEVLARLSETSTRAQALRAGIDVVRAEVESAGRWPNPRVTFNRESVAGVSENIVTVGQPLPVSGRRGLEVKAAAALVDAASGRSDEALRQARAELRLAFARLVSAQRREEVLATAQGRLREVHRVLERREAAGDAAGYDLIRAERELADLDADQALAVADRTRAQGALAGFLEGVEPSRLVAADPSARAAVDLPPISALIDRAISVRGELLALRHEVTAAQLSASAAERRRVPEPEVIAGTKSSSSGGGGVGGVLAVQVSLPWFDRGKPERMLAEAHARQATLRAAAFQQSLRAEIAALRETVVVRRAAAARYRDAAMRVVGEIERIALVSYEAGELGILELLDAHRTVITAATRLTELELAVREAEVELEFVSGWEIPR